MAKYETKSVFNLVPNTHFRNARKWVRKKKIVWIVVYCLEAPSPVTSKAKEIKRNKLEIVFVIKISKSKAEMHRVTWRSRTYSWGDAFSLHAIFYIKSKIYDHNFFDTTDFCIHKFVLHSKNWLFCLHFFKEFILSIAALHGMDVIEKHAKGILLRTKFM